MKRVVVITINAMLVLIIAGLITATWMPAIYTSQWFQRNHWVRRHLLQNEGMEQTPVLKPGEHR